MKIIFSRKELTDALKQSADGKNDRKENEEQDVTIDNNGSETDDKEPEGNSILSELDDQIIQVNDTTTNPSDIVKNSEMTLSDTQSIKIDGSAEIATVSEITPSTRESTLTENKLSLDEHTEIAIEDVKNEENESSLMKESVTTSRNGEEPLAIDEALVTEGDLELLQIDGTENMNELEVTTSSMLDDTCSEKNLAETEENEQVNDREMDVNLLEVNKLKSETDVKEEIESATSENADKVQSMESDAVALSYQESSTVSGTTTMSSLTATKSTPLASETLTLSTSPTLLQSPTTSVPATSPIPLTSTVSSAQPTPKVHLLLTKPRQISTFAKSPPSINALPTEPTRLLTKLALMPNIQKMRENKFISHRPLLFQRPLPQKRYFKRAVGNEKQSVALFVTPSPMKPTNSIPEVENETSLERAERISKAVQKFMNVVKVAGHVDNYLMSRFKSGIRKFGRLFDSYEEEEPRRRRQKPFLG